MTLAHLVLNVTDLERSKAFYEKFLRGFAFSDGDEEYACYRGPDMGVWLVAVGGSERVADDRVGLHHMAFKAETMEELKEWEAHFRDQGIEMQKGGITDDDYGGTGIFLRDPDGFRLEIHLGSVAE